MNNDQLFIHLTFSEHPDKAIEFCSALAAAMNYSDTLRLKPLDKAAALKWFKARYIDTPSSCEPDKSQKG